MATPHYHCKGQEMSGEEPLYRVQREAIEKEMNGLVLAWMRLASPLALLFMLLSVFLNEAPLFWMFALCLVMSIAARYFLNKGMS